MNQNTFRKYYDNAQSVLNRFHSSYIVLDRIQIMTAYCTFFGLCHLVVSRFQYFQNLDEYPKNIAHNGYNCVQWILYEVQHRNARHCIKNINVAIVFVNMTTVWKIMNLHLISTIAQYTCMQIADIVHSHTHTHTLMATHICFVSNIINITHCSRRSKFIEDYIKVTISSGWRVLCCSIPIYRNGVA